jgi:hypothetical protein
MRYLRLTAAPRQSFRCYLIWQSVFGKATAGKMKSGTPESLWRASYLRAPLILTRWGVFPDCFLRFLFSFSPPPSEQFVQGFLGFAVTRLLSDHDDGRVLKLMTLQVIVAGVYYNPILVIQSFAATDPGLPGRFFALWFSNAELFTGLHARKLCIRTVIKLLGLPYAALDANLQGVWSLLLPPTLVFFSRLKEAYLRAVPIYCLCHERI